MGKKNSNNEITLLAVNYDQEKDIYNVRIPAGSNVAETAFCMTVVVKCMLRDKVIDKPEAITELINKYCNDPQYNEISKGEKDA